MSARTRSSARSGLLAASRAGRALETAERRHVLEQPLRCEQDANVAPGANAAIAGFPCRSI